VFPKESETKAGGLGIELNGSTLGTTLLFDRTNWYIPQIVTVTAPADDLAEGIRVFNIQHSVNQGADPNDGGAYDGLVVPSLTAHVYDSDAAGVVIAQANGRVIVSEPATAGAASTVEIGTAYSDHYSVALTRRPSADVQVDISVPPDDQGVKQVAVYDEAGNAITHLTFSSDPAADNAWNKPQMVRVKALYDGATEGSHYARIAHAVVAADVNDFYNLGLSDVALGLKAEIQGDVTTAFSGSVAGDVLTVSAKTPFTASIKEGSATLATAEAAYVDATVTPSGAVGMGSVWTLTLNGTDYTYIAGTDGDALNLAKVVEGLAAKVAADAGSGFTVTADATTTPANPFLTVATNPSGEAFVVRMTQPAGSPTITGTASADHYAALDITPQGTVSAGDAWTVTINGADYRYVSGASGEMTTLPSVDATVTDAQAPGVLVTQTDGSTRVTEPTDEVYLGSGQVVDASVGDGSAILISRAAIFTADFAIAEAPSTLTKTAGKGTLSGVQVWTTANIALNSAVVNDGDKWTVRVESTDYTYTAPSSGLTIEQVADGLYGVLNSNLAAPYAVSHTAGSDTLTINNAAGFSLAMISGSASVNGNTAWRSLSLALTGSVAANETWSLTLGGVKYSYATGTTNLTLAAVAAGLKSAIGGAFAVSSPIPLTQFTADFGAAVLNESPSHSSIYTAQSLEYAKWSKSSDTDIINATTVPHLTIKGSGNGEVDVYKFTVTDDMLNPGGVSTPVNASFDVDHGYDYWDGTLWASKLTLYDSNGTLITSGPGYSDPADLAAGGQGSTTWLDDYLQYQFTTAGDYYVEVSNWFWWINYSNGLPDGVDYELQVSMDRHPEGTFTFSPTPVLKDQNPDGTPQVIDDSDFWYTFYNTEIGDGTVTSTTPYATVVATGDGTTDSYAFTITGEMLSRNGATLGATTTESPSHTYYTSATLDITGSKVAAGDVWTATIDGQDYTYTVQTTDASVSDIAAGLVTAIGTKTPEGAPSAITAITYSATLGAGGTFNIEDANGFWVDLEHDAKTAGIVTRAGSVKNAAAVRLSGADIVFGGTGAVGDRWIVLLTQDGVTTSYSFTTTTTALSDVAEGLKTRINGSKPGGSTYGASHTAGSNTLSLGDSAGNAFSVEIRDVGPAPAATFTIQNAVPYRTYTSADILLQGAVAVGDAWTVAVRGQDGVSTPYSFTALTTSLDDVAQGLVDAINAGGASYTATHFADIVRITDATTGHFFSLQVTPGAGGSATVGGNPVETDFDDVQWTQAVMALTGPYRTGETYNVTINEGKTGAHTFSYVAGTGGYAASLDGVAEALAAAIHDYAGVTYDASYTSGSSFTITDSAGVTIQHEIVGTASQGVLQNASAWAKTTSLDPAGSVTAGEIFTVTLRKTDNTVKSYSYTAEADGVAQVLAGLQTAINADTLYQAQVDSTAGTLTVLSSTKTGFDLLTSRGNISAPVSGWAQTVALSGTPAAGQVWTIALQAGATTETYSFTSTDTNLDTVGAGLATAITGTTGSSYTSVYDSATDTLTVVRKSDTTGFTIVTSRAPAANLAATTGSWAQTIQLSGTPAADQIWSMTLRTSDDGTGDKVFTYQSTDGNTIDNVGSALATGHCSERQLRGPLRRHNTHPDRSCGSRTTCSSASSPITVRLRTSPHG